MILRNKKTKLCSVHIICIFVCLAFGSCDHACKIVIKNSSKDIICFSPTTDSTRVDAVKKFSTLHFDKSVSPNIQVLREYDCIPSNDSSTISTMGEWTRDSIIFRNGISYFYFANYDDVGSDSNTLITKGLIKLRVVHFDSLAANNWHLTLP